MVRIEQKTGLLIVPGYIASVLHLAWPSKLLPGNQGPMKNLLAIPVVSLKLFMSYVASTHIEMFSSNRNTAHTGLLIIDEVHLLADERGAVIESVVSRFHRLVESRQRQVRIVALSATLPNYKDVAEFLQVPERGLFFFGPEHRPVPLQQQFIGVATKSRDRNVREEKLNDICYEEVLDSLKRGHQVS